MGKIQFAKASELEFTTTAESLAASGLSDEQREGLPLSDGELHRLATGVYFVGSASAPQLYEFRAEAGVEVAPHAHESDEILYILEGELRFGARTCGAGDSVHIPARSVYTFRAGPTGCRGLNFRGRLDQSYLTPEQLRTADS